MACSTAAGPAFEGSSITQGMRAARGAIEKVDIREDSVDISVIGDCEPVGICGSGIIDAVGELIRTGIVDKSGRLLDRKKLETFLKSPSDYGKPWYGQLMAGPQMLAYVLQIDYWMKTYKITLL